MEHKKTLQIVASFKNIIINQTEIIPKTFWTAQKKIMRTLIKISKHLDAITQENLIANRRILNFNNAKNVIWKGTKRYAH